MTDDLIERLQGAAEAYPEDVFGKTTDEDRRAHGDVVQRAAATMGRHMAPLLREAAAALEAAREDAERYRWLRMMAKEQLLNPKAAGSECPDMRTYWRIPVLICSGPVGGFVDFDAAIDAAREARND